MTALIYNSTLTTFPKFDNFYVMQVRPQRQTHKRTVSSVGRMTALPFRGSFPGLLTSFAFVRPRCCKSIASASSIDTRCSLRPTVASGIGCAPGRSGSAKATVLRTWSVLLDAA